MKRKEKPKHAKKRNVNPAIIAALVIFMSFFIILAAFFLSKDNTKSLSSNYSETLSSIASGDVPSDSHNSSEQSSQNSAIPFTDKLESSAFSSENGRIYYASSSATYGIDVSCYQGKIDWNAVSKDGISFAMIRAGGRDSSSSDISEDTCYTENIEGALNAGLNVGVYFFSQAISESEAKEEADFVLKLVKNYKITYPIVIDWEKIVSSKSRTASVSGSEVTKYVATFCSEIKSAAYKAGFYFNPSDFSSGLITSELKENIFWMAQYSSPIPDLNFNFDLWQYSNTGRVAGIEGDVDLDISFYDF